MQKKLWLVLFVLGMALSFILFFLYFPEIVYLTFGGMVLAYLVWPMVVHFEKKSMNKVLAISLSYTIIGVLILFICFVIFPVLYKESMGLFQNVQVFYDYFSEIWSWFTEKISSILSLSLVLEWERDILPMLDSKINTVIQSTILRLLELPKDLSYFILSPVIAYYFLRDSSKIGGGFLTFFPPKHRSDVLILAKETDGVIRGFIRGNLLVSLCVAVVTTLGLWLIGVDYPLVLGLLAGIFDIIPYFGPLLGAIPVLLLALLQPEVNILLVIILLVAVQQLENIFISPKIIGDCVGLHPVVIILLVFLGGSIGGILGMILVIPLAAVVKVLAKFFYERFVGYRFH